MPLVGSVASPESTRAGGIFVAAATPSVPYTVENTRDDDGPLSHVQYCVTGSQNQISFSATILKASF